MQQNAPTCTKPGGIYSFSTLIRLPRGWAGGPELHKAAEPLCPSPGAAPSVVIQRRNAGGIQPADGWSRFPKGAKALWSMGSTGSADSSLGPPERVWVSGQERPDWRVSGASTLTSGQPAKRLQGARCWPRRQSRVLRRRGCNGERASGFPLPRLCGGANEILFRLYYTHTSCGHP